jgi:tetratricopeptide (TPR) repeat protein
MTRPSKVLLLTLLVPFVALAAWLAYHETRTPRNQAEVLNRMIELQKEGRYEKAVQVVQNWINVSHDGLMYDQIAFVYIQKAYKQPANRDESIRRAEESLQKALSFFDRQSQNDLSLEPFEIGGAYEILADISDKDKCRLYEKARELFVRQLPLTTGDSYTAYGHTTPLEPVRGDVRKHLNAVDKKLSSAGCQVH